MPEFMRGGTSQRAGTLLIVDLCSVCNFHPMYALCFWVQISMVRVQRPMGNVNADEELAFGLMKDICRPRERDGITAIGLAIVPVIAYCCLECLGCIHCFIQ